MANSLTTTGIKNLATETPTDAALLTLLLGTQADGAPAPRDNETLLRYMERITADERLLVLTGGLDRAVNIRNLMADGIRLAVWWTYSRGWILFNSDAEFRGWVRDTLTADGQSPTEATQLASVILNVDWLDANGNEFDDIDDLDDIFSGWLYQRLRRVAGKMRAAIEVADQEQAHGAGEQAIHTLLEAVENTELTLDDLDRVGRQRPPLPPVVVRELPERDAAGNVKVEMTLTPAQRVLLKQRMGDGISYELEGQAYGADTHRLLEYRSHTRYVCAECGTLDGNCECASQAVTIPVTAWARREYDEDGTSAWEHLADEPDLLGMARDGVPLVDDELGLVYTRVWEGDAE